MPCETGILSTGDLTLGLGLEISTTACGTFSGGRDLAFGRFFGWGAAVGVYGHFTFAVRSSAMTPDNLFFTLCITLIS